MKDFSRAVKEMNVPDIVQEKAQNAFDIIHEESKMSKNSNIRRSFFKSPAAVAAAVYEFRGSRDTLLTHNRFVPNPLVYRLACSELGINRGDLRYRMIPEGMETWRLEAFK